MRILLAFDKCKNSLTAAELCSLGEELLRKEKDNVASSIPLTDGGEGFVEILTRGAKGIFEQYLVRDSLAREKLVKVGICKADSLSETVHRFLDLKGSEKLAVIEMASVAGLADLKMNERNPWKTSTLGIGDLLGKVSQDGADAILLGIGGSSTNDAGLGALVSLGLRFFDSDGREVANPSPEKWSSIAEVDSKNLSYLPPLFIACDVENKLLGKKGATYQFAQQKGLHEKDLPVLEQKMEKIVDKLEKFFPSAKTCADSAGSGAAGGIAFGLSLHYESKLVSGFNLLSHWFDLEKRLMQSDLVITSEGRFDSTSLNGKGPFELIRLSQKYGKPSLVLAGSVEEKAAHKCEELFPDCSIQAFGSEDISLEENLKQAPELFKTKFKTVLANHLRKTKEK